jgi:Kef-type K+ transport system membrane component KefB
MSDLSSFLPDFAIVLCVAAFTTILFHWLKQPSIPGYLLAGSILGPPVSVPLFVHEEAEDPGPMGRHLKPFLNPTLLGMGSRSIALVFQVFRS